MTAAGAPGLLALVYAAHEVLLVADLVERPALAAHVVLEHQGNLVGAGLLRDDAAGVVGIDHQRANAGIVLRRPDVAALARQEIAGLLFDRKSTRLNSSHSCASRMTSSS